MIVKKLQKRANSLARKKGYGKATKIIYGKENCVIQRIDPGYRKITTGEYMMNAYRRNFGRKNTYYQEAVTIVEIDVREELDNLFKNFVDDIMKLRTIEKANQSYSDLREIYDKLPYYKTDFLTPPKIKIIENYDPKTGVLNIL